MKFSCFKACDPNIRNADVLYLRDNDNQNLWNGTAPICSSVSQPAPSRCLVCFQDSLYAVCSYLLEETPVMEGDGNNIQIANNTCPTCKADDPTWIILLIVFILLFSILFIGVGIWKRDKICLMFQGFRGKTEEDEDDAENSNSPHGPFLC
ncbi:uncharacterized protein LOC101166864 isoform X2 [Oryzias latipes]|uniref:uncharacterized protein LOC101166864 isoform X2 n=1 Tax=Oryzias latipes TaxID=8090 RepID=UPI0009DABFE9|nr:uncharacterized protein LOC101166864 isoform X2 [Oryzias latipes]